jgi:hypothetical protein
MELGKEPGVQGLVQLGRNAIERVAQLESENSYLRAANSDGAALLQKLRDRIATLEAERERNEPVATVCVKRTGFNAGIEWGAIRDGVMMNDGDLLYAHPLALRDPTDDECREIRRLAKNEECDGSKVCEGRAMFNAVREVMTK